jgi:CHAD domain-containing protein
MTYRLEPLNPVDRSVREIASAQIGDLLAGDGEGKASANSVHEARKALKRLRALLSLVREGLDGGDLKRERARIREIAASLAGARDAHVMLETARSLREGAMPRGCHAASKALIKLLEARPAGAETQLASGGDGCLPVDALEEARASLEALPLGDLSFKDLLGGFVATYRRGRAIHKEVLQGEAEDERYHDLRKQVQQHWRHLQLLSKAWPKAMRPQIALAHELAEALGRDHDISVLADFARGNAEEIGAPQSLEAYLGLCAASQAELRERAALLARRLYADKPEAVRRRMRVWWETAGALQRGKGASGNGKAEG